MEYTNRKTQYLYTFAVSLASLTSCVAFTWTTPVLPKFHNNETSIHLSDNEMSWLVSMTAPGMMAGCLAAQYPADRFGRRVTLLASAFPFIIGTTFILVATKAWMLCLGRFCWGFACGVIQSVSMIYIVEIASQDIRGKLGVGNRFMFNLGSFIVLSIGSLLSYQTLSCFLIVLPVCYFIACWLIPETPYYLLKNGKVDDARKGLMRLNGNWDEKVLDEKLTEMRNNVKHDMQRSGGLKELLTGKNYRRAIVISVGLTVSRFMTGSIPMKQYLGRILQETKSDVSVTTGLIISGAVRFTTGMLASLLVDKVGRRPLLIMSFIGTTILLAILGGCFFMAEVMNTTPPYFGYINLLGNLLLCIVSTLGYDTVGYIILAEIFPLNVKSVAMTYMNLFSHTFNFTVVRGYQVVKDLSGLYGVFWFYGIASFIGTVFTYMVVPETKGKSLKEIQQELQGDLYGVINTKPDLKDEDLASIAKEKEIEVTEELKPLKT